MHRRLPLPLHGSPTAARAGRAGRGRARAGRARAGFFFFFLLVKAKSSSSSSSSAAAAAAAAGSATPPSSASSSFGFFCRIAARRALVRPHAGTGGCTQAGLSVCGGGGGGTRTFFFFLLKSSASSSSSPAGAAASVVASSSPSTGFFFCGSGAAAGYCAQPECGGVTHEARRGLGKRQGDELRLLAGASHAAHCCGECRTGLGWCTCARQARRAFFFFKLKSISGSASSPMTASREDSSRL